MQQFVRGQRAKISQLADRTRLLSVEIALQSPRLPTFDFVCFGIDGAGKLSDDRYMVFFNQKSAPDDSIILEELRDQNARFSVNLDLVPPQISRWVFTASIDGKGTMSELGTGALTLKEAGISPSQTLLEYRFFGADFNQEGALMLAEIYRKNGEWRFWAQGQGFAGNLSALLAHFGGQEAESTAPPVVQPSPVQPSPPISSPAVISVPVPAVPVVPGFANSLQQTLAQTPAGGVLTLPRGEHPGPIVIEKPLVLDGAGAVIWAKNGPVVIVQSVGVTLKNLEIEVTSPDENATNANVALWAAPGMGTQLQNVRTRGEVLGIAAAEGRWRLPPALDLGEMAPRAENSFQIEVETPQPCDIKANITGVSLLPSRLESGRQKIEIRVQNVGNDTFLTGNLEFSTGGIARTVPVSGRTASQPRPAVEKLVLWQVDDAE